MVGYTFPPPLQVLQIGIFYIIKKCNVNLIVQFVRLLLESPEFLVIVAGASKNM